VPLCFCLFVDPHHHYATHSRNVDSPNQWRRRRICEGPGVLIVFVWFIISITPPTPVAGLCLLGLGFENIFKMQGIFKINKSFQVMLG